MVTKVNNAEGGGNTGDLVTLASTGDSGDAFDTVNNTNGLLVYDGTVGSMAYRFGTATGYAGGQHSLIWNLGTTPTVSGRASFYLSALPTAQAEMRNLIFSGPPSAMIWFPVYADGTLRFLDNAGQFAAFTQPVTAQSWYRLEWSLTLGASGSYDIRLYPGMYATTALDAVSGTRDFSGVDGTVQFGDNGYEPGLLWMDDLLVSTDSALPGPAQPPPPPTNTLVIAAPIAVTASQQGLSPLFNDNFADAYPVIITTDGGTFSATANTTNFTRETGEPGSNPGTADHSAWWWYRPTSSGSVTIDTLDSSYDTLLHVYTGSAVNALTMWAFDDDGGGGRVSRITLAVTAATRYYIRASSYNGTEFGTLNLHVTGPATVQTPITAPPIQAGARTDVTGRDYISLAPIDCGAGLSAPGVDSVIVAPFGAVATPEIPVVLRRAPGDGLDTIAVTWSVTDSQPQPHLWFVDPGRAAAGENVTIVGQGFSDTPKITIADVPVTVVSSTLVPATDATTTTARAINSEVIDPEHAEVVIIVPEVDDDIGGPLIVES